MQNCPVFMLCSDGESLVAKGLCAPSYCIANIDINMRCKEKFGTIMNKRGSYMWLDEICISRSVACGLINFEKEFLDVFIHKLPEFWFANSIATLSSETNFFKLYILLPIKKISFEYFSISIIPIIF